MAYLFTHFIGEQPQGEQIYFSLSKDGLHWKDLHDGKPVICSEVGECGLRDPFLIRKADGSGFVIIATDLCIANGMLQLKLEAKIWLLWSRRISFIGVSRY